MSWVGATGSEFEMASLMVEAAVAIIINAFWACWSIAPPIVKVFLQNKASCTMGSLR